MAKKAPALFYGENRFCAGCGHGLFNRILGEVLEEMDIVGDTIICSDIGCNHQFQFWMNVDAIVPPHGKMGAALTAQKRVRPDKYALSHLRRRRRICYWIGRNNGRSYTK